MDTTLNPQLGAFDGQWVRDAWSPMTDSYLVHRLGFYSQDKVLSGQLAHILMTRCPRVGSFGDVDR